MAHAFEMDNLTWPNTGVHPGATMAMPAIAVAQERGIGGRELIAAVVAGSIWSRNRDRRNCTPDSGEPCCGVCCSSRFNSAARLSSS